MLHEKILYDILNKINNGEYKNGDKLPTEIELVKKYGVSRTCVIKALSQLKEMGFAISNKKGGTVINLVSDTSKKYNVPVILPYCSNIGTQGGLYYNSHLLSGIQHFALNNNINCPYYNYSGSNVIKRNILEHLLKERPDGILIYPKTFIEFSDIYSKIELLKIPVCFIDRKFMASRSPVIATDNYSGMKTIVKHLINEGHKYIGFYGFYKNSTNPTTIMDRFRGYYDAHTESGLTVYPHLIFYHESVGFAAPDYLFDCFFNNNDKNATAVACISDGLAYTLQQLLARHNIRVPEDVSVAGFDNIINEGVLPYKLTTIEQDFYKIGYTAAKTILKMINGQPVKDVSVPGKFVPGTSDRKI
mgnify:CR=1 FL=1